MGTFELILIILAAVSVLLLLFVVIRQSASLKQDAQRDLRNEVQQIRGQIDMSARTNAEFNSNLRSEMTAAIEKLSETNEERLLEMQGIVNNKLDTTLNARLDTNFSKVSEQLARLYRSLGELQDMQSGVSELNKTLSNVKTRGIWGEVQLKRILEDTLARNQYEENVATKKNSADRVEFAVRFPSQEEDGEPVYLPIDAKFPSDLYNRIVEASESGSSEAVQEAVAALRSKILSEAQKIATKYLDPPRTTTYAFLYLPTEGLYSEALRIDGLSEECQKKGIILTGPTTITAVLNSLQVGFRNIALSKKSVEVLKILEAVKGQLDRIDRSLDTTQKKLTEAMNQTEDLKKRTWHISNRLKKITEIDEAESDRLLAMDDMDFAEDE